MNELDQLEQYKENLFYSMVLAERDRQEKAWPNQEKQRTEKTFVGGRGGGGERRVPAHVEDHGKINGTGLGSGVTANS